MIEIISWAVVHNNCTTRLHVVASFRILLSSLCNVSNARVAAIQSMHRTLGCMDDDEMISRWRSGGIGIRLRKLTVRPLALERIITSEALESLLRIAHEGNTTSSESSKIYFARRIGMRSEPKPDIPTIWETSMAMFPLICVIWWKA